MKNSEASTLGRALKSFLEDKEITEIALKRLSILYFSIFAVALLSQFAPIFTLGFSPITLPELSYAYPIAFAVSIILSAQAILRRDKVIAKLSSLVMASTTTAILGSYFYIDGWIDFSDGQGDFIGEIFGAFAGFKLDWGIILIFALLFISLYTLLFELKGKQEELYALILLILLTLSIPIGWGLTARASNEETIASTNANDWGGFPSLSALETYLSNKCYRERTTTSASTIEAEVDCGYDIEDKEYWLEIIEPKANVGITGFSNFEEDARIYCSSIYAAYDSQGLFQDWTFTVKKNWFTSYEC